MTRNERARLRFAASFVSVGLLFLARAGTSDGQDPVEELPVRLPGLIEGSGTVFEISGSEYLDVKLESSEPVSVRLESIARMVQLRIESAEGAASTEITLSGFPPSSVQYKYEDDYHRLTTLAVDAEGSCNYTQDLTEAHHVFIQPQPSTRFIPADSEIGIWDEGTRIYTLTTDVTESIQIDESSLTLDGAGHRASGAGTGNGVYVAGKSGVTLKDLTVEGFANGIYVVSSYHCLLEGNTASDNTYGIMLETCVNALLSGNTMAGNRYNFHIAEWGNGPVINYYHQIDTTNTIEGRPLYYVRNAQGQVFDGTTLGALYLIECDGITVRNLDLSGANTFDGVLLRDTHNSLVEGCTVSYVNSAIRLVHSHHNELRGNTITDSGYGARLYGSDLCVLRGNHATSGVYGIRLSSVGDLVSCTLENNVTSNNREYGIDLGRAPGSILSGNVASNNGHSGILIQSTGGVTLTGNALSGNLYNLYIDHPQFPNAIDDTNTVEGKKVLYLLGQSDRTFEDTDEYGTVYVLDGQNIVLRNLTLANNNQYGVYFYSTEDSTIDGVTTSNNYEGVRLEESSRTTLRDCTLPANYYGVFLSQSHDSILTGNSSSGNHGHNFYFRDSNGLTVMGNTANSSVFGMGFHFHSGDGLHIEGNTANNNSPRSYNGSAISISSVTNSTIVGNVMRGNFTPYGLHAGGLYNVVRGNIMEGNQYWGVRINGPGHVFLENTVADNSVGGLALKVTTTIDNQIYNNNFINNPIQAQVFDGTGAGNVFHLSKPIGGNYWSDWTGPDDDGDGFVDIPYVFYGGQDDLPWAIRDGWLNQRPEADAGEDQSVHPCALTVTLDGSRSSDPDGDYPLTYSWRFTGFPDECEPVLYDPGTVSPTFLPDCLGDYVIELIVTDSRGLQSEPDTVTVSTFNAPPVADAGQDQPVDVLGTRVELDGSQSWDPDGDSLEYSWTLTQRPDGSSATLDDPTLETPSFFADVHDEHGYVITLVVTDCFGAESAADSVTVSFANVPPVPVPGLGQSVIVGSTVDLDGSESYDLNLDPLAFFWSFVSKPECSAASFDPPDGAQTSFLADCVGAYVVELKVDDGFESRSETVLIQVISVENALTLKLQELIEAIRALDPAVLKNRNMRNSLINKVNATLSKVENGFYEEVLDKLENDIREKTNGCAESDAADRNDWITECDGGQHVVYPLVMEAIALTEAILAE